MVGNGIQIVKKTPQVFASTGKQFYYIRSLKVTLISDLISRGNILSIRASTGYETSFNDRAGRSTE